MRLLKDADRAERDVAGSARSEYPRDGRVRGGDRDGGLELRYGRGDLGGGELGGELRLGGSGPFGVLFGLGPHEDRGHGGGDYEQEQKSD